MYKPIDNAFKLIFSAIGENFNKSENKYIKNIKSKYFFIKRIQQGYSSYFK